MAIVAGNDTSSLKAEVQLLPRDVDNIRAVTAALKQVNVTHPSSLSAVLTFLEKRLPDKNASSTMLLHGKGGKTILEARAFNGKLFLTAPLPAHMKEPWPRQLPLWGGKPAAIRNKTLLIENSRVLLALFQDVLDYNPRRGHNGGPPELWLEDKHYLNDVRQLVSELKRLNDLLERRASKSDTTKATVELAQSLQKTFDGFGETFGKSLGVATAAAIAGATLYFAGVSPEAVAKYYKLFK